MKLSCSLFALILCSLTSASAQAMPAWMQVKNDAIERPSKMTSADQVACTESILTEMNRHFKTSFTVNDLAPVQMPNWDHPEAGFIRGGGYNIRIATSLHKGDQSVDRIKAGRFSTLQTALEAGAQPSLHIPAKIGDQMMFIKQASADQTRTTYDFIAHSDSAYAFLPLGSFMHLFEDVIGSRTRRPCPVEGSVEKEIRADTLVHKMTAEAAAFAKVSAIETPDEN